MTASVRQRTSFSRTLVALAGVALLALLALAAVLLGTALTEHGGTSGSDLHGVGIAATGEPSHTVPTIHAFHQQPSTRARSVAFGVLAAVVVVGGIAFRRVRFARTGRPRTLRITGLPSGRAPPALRIV